MAKKNEVKPINLPRNKIVKSIQSGIDDLYKKTYFNQNDRSLDYIRNKMNTTLDNILGDNVTNYGVPNISRLYERIKLKEVQGDKTVIKKVEDIFGDRAVLDNLIASYNQNKYIKDFDEEIDTVLKYMPQLEEALEVKKDNVLSADHFSKDFLNLSSTTKGNETLFNDRVVELKDKYNLLEFVEKSYSSTAKYGEDYIYVVPYAKALQKLIDARDSGINNPKLMVNCENATITSDSTSEVIKMDKEMLKEAKYNLNIELNMSGVLESCIRNNVHANRALREHCSAFTETYKDEDTEDTVISELAGPIFDKTIPDDTSTKDFGTSNDGLIQNKNGQRTKIKVPGCIVKRLPRENVIPIYIEDICLGYYYLEFKDNDNGFEFSNTMNDPLGSTKSNSKLMRQNDNQQRDNTLKYISAQLSNVLDSKFINANQDLRKEIYMILKHNDIVNFDNSQHIRVTFIPAEDMHHIYFDKSDIDHRGISDLYRALLPAKLYACLYVTNTIGIMTRGYDKRVYYVKQNVETNISRTLLNTIEQIKRSNFGMREVA